MSVLVFRAICVIFVVLGFHGCASDVQRDMREPVASAMQDSIVTSLGHASPAGLDTAPPVEDEAPSPIDFAAIMRGVRPRGFGAGSYSLIAPSAGGTTFYVAPSGNDLDPGTSSAPFGTINRAAEVAEAGDVVIIRDGTYRESVYVKNSGTLARPIVFQAENIGAVVLTGGQYIFRPHNFVGSIGATPQKYIIVKGLLFRAYAGNRKGAIALRAARGWVIEDCLFDNSASTGFAPSDHDITVRRTTFQYHHFQAISAYGGYWHGNSPSDPAYRPMVNLQLIDVVLRGNNTRPRSAVGATGGRVSKFVNTRELLIDNVESYDNKGPGLWLDTKNTDFTIRNSYFHNNQGFTDQNGIFRSDGGLGVYLEKNWGPGLFENNVFADNSGAGIIIVNTDNARFRNNLFARNAQSIQLINSVDPGYELFTLKNLSFRGTHMKGWRATGSIWARGGDFSAGAAAMGLSMDESVYDTTGIRVNLVTWPAPLYGAATIGEVRNKYGWEHNGTVARIPW